MKPEFNNQQSNKLNWIEKLGDLDRIEELNDAEAARVSGGYSMSFSAQLAKLQASFAEAQQRNIEMRKLTTEEGTELKAAGKDVNPK